VGNFFLIEMEYITPVIAFASLLANLLFFNYQKRIVKSQEGQIENIKKYAELFNVDEFTKLIALKIELKELEHKKEFLKMTELLNSQNETIANYIKKANEFYDNNEIYVLPKNKTTP